jgi:hypothetical protein
MKKLNAVRWAAFLMTLLANADAVETKMMVGRSTNEHNAKCERCGQNGPTVPVTPVVFRGRAVVALEAPRGPRNANLWPDVRPVRENPGVPMRNEFDLDTPGPSVGAVFTQ